jgi:hypothetical protein
MPIDYYPNKTLEELAVLLGKLQGRQSLGAVTDATAAGVRVARSHGASSGNARTEVEILRVLYSAYKRALGTDEAVNWPNPYASRITRTRADYR